MNNDRYFIKEKLLPHVFCSRNGETQPWRSEGRFNNSLCEIILIHLSDLDHTFLRSYIKLQYIHFSFCKIYFVKQILVTWYYAPVFLTVLDTTSHHWCYFKHGLIEEFGSTNTVCWDNCKNRTVPKQHIEWWGSWMFRILLVSARRLWSQRFYSSRCYRYYFWYFWFAAYVTCSVVN